MITITDAIRSLTTGASFTVIGDEINWFSPDIPQPTQAEIDAEITRLQAEHAATEYKRLRAPEYPSIGDQLDAILKHLNYRRTQGDELVQEMDDIIGDWLAVKARFPKNG
jgi:hypothetical protein